MRIPVDPLGALERAALSETTDLQQAEAITAARRIGTGLASQTPSRPRMQKTPDAQSEAPGKVQQQVAYQGEERRMGERRLQHKSALLDTRVRADRRHKPARPRVDLKV